MDGHTLLNTHTHTHALTIVFVEEFSPLFSRLGFENDFFTTDEEDEEETVKGDLFPPAEGRDKKGFPPLEEGDDDEEGDFILFISASKTEARFLTMVSRSDCFDLRARGSLKKKKKSVTYWQCFNNILVSYEEENC